MSWIHKLYGLREVVVVGDGPLLEPAHLLGDLVEGVLQHDSLRDDQHHVRGHEQLALNRGVHPLEAALCAGQLSAVVEEDAAPELDRDVAENEEALEEQIHVHLL